MQAEEFDLALQLHGSGVYANPFTLMLGARATAGFIRPGDPAGRLAAALPLPESGHEIRRVLSLPVFLGAPPQGDETEFPLWPEDHAAAEELLRGAERPLIGLHPAAREATKRWPAERFAALAGQLQRCHGGTVVLVGGADELPLAEAVARACRPLPEPGRSHHPARPRRRHPPAGPARHQRFRAGPHRLRPAHPQRDRVRRHRSRPLGAARPARPPARTA